jgi:hypothetical protein
VRPNKWAEQCLQLHQFGAVQMMLNKLYIFQE